MTLPMRPMEVPMTDLLAPNVQLLTKLGSIARHADEYLSDAGHDFDRQAILSLLADPQIQDWLNGMDAMALLPRKRTP